MTPQHLSDEALAAFADGVLSGSARDRATRHVNGCAECRQAVKEQREAASALRTAPPPALPTALLDRLRTVPTTTPLPAPPSTFDSEGNPLLATFAPMAAFAPGPAKPRHRRTYLAGAVLAGLTGAVVAGAVVTAENDPQPGAGHPATPVHHLRTGNDPGIGPVNLFRDIRP